MTQYSKADKIPGFQANGVRLPMVANFEYQIRTNGIKVRSSRLISEMKTFVYKNGKADHMDGYHDDLIMAMAMPLWVVEHSFKNLKKLKTKTKAILNSWATGTNDTGDLNQVNRGSGFVPRNNRNKKAIKRPNFDPKVSRNMQDPKGEYMWLFSGSK